MYLFYSYVDFFFQSTNFLAEIYAQLFKSTPIFGLKMFHKRYFGRFLRQFRQNHALKTEKNQKTVKKHQIFDSRKIGKFVWLKYFLKVFTRNLKFQYIFYLERIMFNKDYILDKI